MELIGRYRVVRQLGHGGMGDVFLARDPILERDVALKLLHPDSKQAGLREEAKSLAALSHPGIVTVYEIGEHDGRDFIAMEYLPGRSLREQLSYESEGSRRLVHRRELIAICAKVADAVGAAHRAGILHRDIKPENVVVDEYDHVKVVDFGIARRLEHEQRRTTRAITAQDVVETLRRTMPPELGTATLVSAGTQTVFGTPAYMAPEVLLGAASTASSDVYSLGVMLYECIEGRRPYAASALVEVMAQMIEGPPGKLDDPCGELIDQMLASDPAKRPTAMQVASRLQELTAPPPRVAVKVVSVPVHVERPRGRAAFVIGAIGAACAMAALGFAIWRTYGKPAAPVAVAAPPVVTASIGIAPPQLTVPSYGAEPPNAVSVADVLARVLDQYDGIHLTATGLQVGDARAQATGMDYLVTGKIREDAGRLHGTFELTKLPAGTRVTSLEVDGPSGSTAPVIEAAAAKLAAALAPGAPLSRARGRHDADPFTRQGKDDVTTNGHFTDARPYLEEAVATDPASFEAWYELALVDSWMNASEDTLLDVAEHAIATAPPGAEQSLMRGIALFIAQDYGEARKLLEPLEHDTSLDAETRKQLLYYLGEVNWHDGRHDVAFAYFQQALALDQRFRPPTMHAMQYTVARRDAEHGRFFAGLAGYTPWDLEFALGNYAKLADGGPPNLQLAAAIVQQQPIPDRFAVQLAAANLDGAQYRIARAIADGDRPAASRELAAAWPAVTAKAAANELTEGDYYQLEGLGEILIAAGMVDATKQLIALLAAQSKSRPVRGYQRLSILAAPVVGDASLIVHDGLSSRNAELAEASAAELAGDRARAIEILERVVGDPTAIWDYPERAALLRNLRARHDKKRAAQLCADTLEPAVFRMAYLVLRHACAAK